MPENKTSTQELVWLYRLRQAPLLLAESGAEPLLRTGAYHLSHSDCPCNPWDECDCWCHDKDFDKSAGLFETPVA